MLSEFKVFQYAKEFYWLCLELKLERFLRDQLLRASSSIALNIAEGSGKRTRRDQNRFYSMALDSLRECQAILQLERVDNPKIIELADRLGAILFRLSRIQTEPTENKTGTQTIKRQTGPDN
jgi:four helix bundle protein